MDCGSEIGNAAKYNRQLAAQKHLRYMGTAQIIMPENYIAMFHAPQAEQARRIVEQAAPALQKALAQVRAGQEFSPLRDTPLRPLYEWPGKPGVLSLFCEGGCLPGNGCLYRMRQVRGAVPLNNIRLENGKPVWGKNTAPTAWPASAIAPKRPSSTAKRAKASPGTTLKHWKSSRTYKYLIYERKTRTVK